MCSPTLFYNFSRQYGKKIQIFYTQYQYLYINKYIVIYYMYGYIKIYIVYIHIGLFIAWTDIIVVKQEKNIKGIHGPRIDK